MDFSILDPEDMLEISASKTVLMDLVILTNKYTNLCPLIDEYCKKNPSEIDAHNDGVTPLHNAILHYTKSSIQIIEILLKNGANINMQMPNGGTVLHLSTHVRDLRLNKLLLKYGADVNVKNSYNCSPVSWAAGWNDFPFVKLLLEYDGSPTFNNYCGLRCVEKMVKDINLLNGMC